MYLKRFYFSLATMNSLVRIALPMVISQGAFAAMLFTDRYFLALIDPTHMAAGLGGGIASFFCISLFTGILSYGNALVAQYLGAKQHPKCSLVISQGLIMCILCIPLLVILALCVVNLFEFMGHDSEQVVLEKAYFTLLMYGGVITLMKITMASFFTGTGRTSVVMICDVIGICINIPLSYALILGNWGLPDMGIEGAAISTIVSTFLSFCLLKAFYLARASREKFSVLHSYHFNSGIMRRYIRLGLPSGLEMFLNVAAFNLFLLMFQSYGIPEAASAAIVFNWDIVSFVPMMGLNIAVMSMIGHAVGARDISKSNEIISAGWALGLGYSAILAFCFVVFRYPLVEIFIQGDEFRNEILALAPFMMVGMSTYVMAEALLQVASGVLRGAGDTRWIMTTSVSLHWIMLVAQYFIIKVLELGPRVSWLGFVCMILAISMVFLYRLKSARWRDPERLEKIMAE